MSTTQRHEPLGITSTPISALAAIGDHGGGFVVVVRNEARDTGNSREGYHHGYTLRVLNDQAVSLGCDRTLSSGLVSGRHWDTRHKMLSAALSFLSEAAEQYMSPSTESDPPLFRESIVEWAYQNSGQITMAQTMLDEWLADFR